MAARTTKKIRSPTPRLTKSLLESMGWARDPHNSEEMRLSFADCENYPCELVYNWRRKRLTLSGECNCIDLRVKSIAQLQRVLDIFQDPKYLSRS